jgi:hypothetical protein
MKLQGGISPPGFRFEPLTEKETLDMFKTMPDSSATGISEIPFKIVKSTIHNLTPIITLLFN